MALSHPGPRGIKATLRSAFFTPNFYRKYTDSGTPSGVVPTSTYKATIKQIHTDVVTRTMFELPPNKVLNSRPPPISTEEQSLPRAHRTTLSRLRSGTSPALNSYLAATGRSPTDSCPSCGMAAHTTSHVFHCQAHPTNLSPLDLWERPVTFSRGYHSSASIRGGVHHRSRLHLTLPVPPSPPWSP